MIDQIESSRIMSRVMISTFMSDSIRSLIKLTHQTAHSSKVAIFFAIKKQYLNQLLRIKMRNQRGNKLDWSKAFRQISVKKQFDSLQASEYQAIAPQILEQNKKKAHQDKKQQIIIPKIEVVPRVTKVKSFSGIPYEYIRLKKEHNLPKLNFYELTQVDHIFVNAHEGRFKLNNRNTLTNDFLQRAFLEMETKAGKNAVIPRAKGWMTSFIEAQYKEYTKMEKYQQFAETVYNYWRNRRQELKFPLYRPLWRPNPDEYNNLLAFKQRQKEKRNLRRANRISDQEISFQLLDQFNSAMKIIQRTRKREQVKLKQIQLQMLSFHNETRQFNQKDKEVMAFYEQFKRENWPQIMKKDKDDIKNLQAEYEGIKKKRQIKQEYLNQDEGIDTVYDQKTTVTNFISTTISIAQSFGITYDTLFSNSYYPSTIPLNPSVSVSATSNTRQDYFPVAPIQRDRPISTGRFTVPLNTAFQEKDNFVQADKGDYVNTDLHIENNFLYRSFNSSTTQQLFQRQQFYDKYLDCKIAVVSNFFFGQDDQGDIKDIKRTTAANFKKFQQTKKQE